SCWRRMTRCSMYVSSRGWDGSRRILEGLITAASGRATGSPGRPTMVQQGIMRLAMSDHADTRFLSLPPTRLQRFGRWLLARFGWRVRFDGLPAPRGVVIVYPHTSNWDFIVGLLAKWTMGV